MLKLRLTRLGRKTSSIKRGRNLKILITRSSTNWNC